MGKTALGKLAAAALPLALLCCAACHRQRPAPAARDITQVRRIVIFPFPGDRENSDLFYALAAEELWPGKAAPQEEVLMALRTLGLGARGLALSKAQAVAIAANLGADALAVGYLDSRRVLRVKAVDVATGAEWGRERQLAAGEGMRIFVEEVKADFKDSRGTAFRRPARKKTPAPARRRPAPEVKAEELPRAEVRASTASVEAGPLPPTVTGKLPPPETKPVEAELEPLGETSVFGFDYHEIGRKDGR